jgi:hypothetical protein
MLELLGQTHYYSLAIIPIDNTKGPFVPFMFGNM